MNLPAPALALRWLLLPFLLVMAAMAWIGAPLTSAVAPRGIVTLELCALTADCAVILRTWTATQREHAMLSLGLDYLYLLLYPAVIAAALLWLAQGMVQGVRTAATWLARLLVLAAVADAVENLCLIQMLLTGRVEVFALPAALCASAKFAVIALALLGLALGLGLRLAAGLRPARRG